MYAKALIAGQPVDLPFLVTTTQEGDAVMPRLRAWGWERYARPVSDGAAGRLRITHQSLQLVVADLVLLDDLNPAAPSGWWDAVDSASGRCFVVVARDGDLDLKGPPVRGRMTALQATGRAVWAALPVAHRTHV